MATRRRIRRLAWFVVPAFLGAGTLYWVLAPRLPHDARSGISSGFGLTSSEKSIFASGGNFSHMGQAMDLVRTPQTDRLVEAYADWATDRTAVEARRLLLNALLAPEAPGLKLSNVLSALDADSTPVEDDPLWSYAVDKIAGVWHGKTLTQGLDLMVAEPRERARRAVISSFAALVNSGRIGELDGNQRQTLTDHFIDGFRQLPSGQKSEVEQAIRKLAGNDAADILLGKGMGDGYELEHEREYKKSLKDAQQALAPTRDPSTATQ
jgi:hypothetical protein